MDPRYVNFGIAFVSAALVFVYFWIWGTILPKNQRRPVVNAFSLPISIIVLGLVLNFGNLRITCIPAQSVVRGPEGFKVYSAETYVWKGELDGKTVCSYSKLETILTRRLTPPNSQGALFYDVVIETLGSVDNFNKSMYALHGESLKTYVERQLAFMEAQEEEISAFMNPNSGDEQLKFKSFVKRFILNSPELNLAGVNFSNARFRRDN
jgi:hypothetical protein